MEICQNTFDDSFSMTFVVDVFWATNNFYAHIQIHHKIALKQVNFKLQTMEHRLWSRSEIKNDITSLTPAMLLSSSPPHPPSKKKIFAEISGIRTANFNLPSYICLKIITSRKRENIPISMQQNY